MPGGIIGMRGRAPTLMAFTLGLKEPGCPAKEQTLHKICQELTSAMKKN